MPTNKLVENVLAVAEHASAKIPRSWSNIRSIAIKTPESTSLTIYHKLAQEMQEIAEKAGLEPQPKERKPDENKEQKPKHSPEKDEATTPTSKPPTTKSPLVKALQKSKKDDSATKEKKRKDTTIQKVKKKMKASSR